jgi:hypothetical protein|tara:strand:+ start:8160 stop:9044 length:885 start_codon:yes stop_codon:yes gene_type:complete
MPHNDPNVREELIQPSTLENIDAAMLEWLDDEMNIFSTTNKGWKKVPVLWVAPERVYQIKNKKELRDTAGSLILPIITLERTSVVKSLSKKGSVFGNVPAVGDEKGGSIVIARRIQQDKTAAFTNADTFRRPTGDDRVGRSADGQINFPRKTAINPKTVYETITIPIPVYLDITYSVFLRTEYQEQMNEIMTPFLTKTGGINYFTVTRDSHRYEAFIQEDFALDNNVNLMEEEEREYKTKIEIKVLGYIYGKDKNDDQPKIVIRENIVDVKIGRERVVWDDDPEFSDKRSVYRG